jgi:hypothetical protein
VGLVGTICCRDGKPKPFAECIKTCQEGGCNHSLPLLSAMRANTERRKGIGISSSVLSQCPRQYILQERNDYYESPSDYYPRWRGSFGHYAIEMGGPYPPEILMERRFYRNISVDGVAFELSGQPDWYDSERRHLSDHKFVGYRPKELRPDHDKQINVYSWLLDGASLPVDTASVVYMDAKGEVEFDVPLWSTEAVEGYIIRSLRPHIEYAQTGNLAGVGIADTPDEWKAKYCPFRHDCNKGRCCIT